MLSSNVMNRSVLEALCDALGDTYGDDSAYEEVPSHTVLARRDDITRYVFLLRSGVLGWRAQDQRGRSALLRCHRAPAVVGLAEGLVGKGQLGDLVSLTVCRIARVPFDELRGLVLEGDDLGRQLLQLLADELRACMKRIHDLMLLDSGERLLQTLHRVAADGAPATDVGKRVAMPLSQCHTAEWLGISPQHFSNLLARLEREQRIRRHRGWFLLLDGGCPSTLA